MIRIYEFRCDECGEFTENEIEITPEELADPACTKHRTPPENGCKACGSKKLTKSVARSVRLSYAQGSLKGKMNNQW